jgi:two-component system, OmpR family, alkaline phosphatase synthesis response regulator PhoP
MAIKILIIEDDISTSQFLSYTMEREGYQPITALDGIDGLKKALAEKPDLIILDIMLPGLDGFELCHRLRTWAATADIPVLILSAKAQDADKSAALKMGANYYIVKPADPAKIVDAVKNMLKEPTPGAIK